MDKAYKIPTLPLAQDIETLAMLRILADARGALGVCKEAIHKIPNKQILLSILPITEAHASSEIEHIFTTQEELFQAKVHDGKIPANIKEVLNYSDSLVRTYESILKKNAIEEEDIIKIYQSIKDVSTGYRMREGTYIGNEKGEKVYTPPQSLMEIEQSMTNLVKYINIKDKTLDPLIKMAIIHHQFESIHPFPDGNGRTGRIINIVYLVLQNLLDAPILYLSRYIIKTKNEYYRLLQAVRDDNVWEEWIIYMLKGVAEVANETTLVVNKVESEMVKFKEVVKEKYPKIYSHELVNSIFSYPYTTVSFLERDLQKTNNTVRKYLKTLKEGGLLDSIQKGKETYYFHLGLLKSIGIVG